MMKVTTDGKRKYAIVTYSSADGWEQLSKEGIAAINAAIKPFVISGAIIGENHLGATYWEHDYGRFIVFKNDAAELEDIIKRIVDVPENKIYITVKDVTNEAVTGKRSPHYRWSSGSFSPAAWHRFVVNDYEAFIKNTTEQCEVPAGKFVNEDSIC